jgi:hypothetical protein
MIWSKEVVQIESTRQSFGKIAESIICRKTRKNTIRKLFWLDSLQSLVQARILSFRGFLSKSKNVSHSKHYRLDRCTESGSDDRHIQFALSRHSWSPSYLSQKLIDLVWLYHAHELLGIYSDCFEKGDLVIFLENIEQKVDDGDDRLVIEDRTNCGFLLCKVSTKTLTCCL